MPSNNEVTLSVGGRIYRSWKEITIKRSIYAVSGSFHLGLTGIPSDTKFALPLEAGDECEVALGPDPLITGYIDSVSMTMDASQKTISVSGRDKTADLVDCSAVAGKNTWQDVPFEKIAQDLLKPFSIPLQVETQTGKPFAAWHIANGESVFDCLSRAAKLRGLLLITDGKGSLVVTQASGSKSQAYLKEGENLLSLSKQHDVKAQFKTYQVDSHLPPELAFQMDTGFLVRAQALDPYVKRNRTLIVMAEGLATKDAAKLRAEFEMSVRQSKSKKITVIVQGFRSNLREVWSIGNSVKLESEFLNEDHSFLITSVNFHLDSTTGKRTTLELEPLGALAQDPTFPLQQNKYQALMQGVR